MRHAGFCLRRLHPCPPRSRIVRAASRILRVGLNTHVLLMKRTVESGRSVLPPPLSAVLNDTHTHARKNRLCTFTAEPHAHPLD